MAWHHMGVSKGGVCDEVGFQYVEGVQVGSLGCQQLELCFLKTFLRRREGTWKRVTFTNE